MKCHCSTFLSDVTFFKHCSFPAVLCWCYYCVAGALYFSPFDLLANLAGDPRRSEQLSQILLAPYFCDSKNVHPRYIYFKPSSHPGVHLRACCTVRARECHCSILLLLLLVLVLPLGLEKETSETSLEKPVLSSAAHFTQTIN